MPHLVPLWLLPHFWGDCIYWPTCLFCSTVWNAASLNIYRPETALPPAGTDKVPASSLLMSWIATRVDLKILPFLLSHVKICMKLWHQESDQCSLPRDQSFYMRSSVSYFTTFALLKFESWVQISYLANDYLENEGSLYSWTSLPGFLFVKALKLFPRLNEYLIIYRVIMNPLPGS